MKRILIIVIIFFSVFKLGGLIFSGDEQDENKFGSNNRPEQSLTTPNNTFDYNPEVSSGGEVGEGFHYDPSASSGGEAVEGFHYDPNASSSGEVGGGFHYDPNASSSEGGFGNNSQINSNWPTDPSEDTFTDGMDRWMQRWKSKEWVRRMTPNYGTGIYDPIQDADDAIEDSEDVLRGIDSAPNYGTLD